METSFPSPNHSMQRPEARDDSSSAPKKSHEPQTSCYAYFDYLCCSLFNAPVCGSCALSCLCSKLGPYPPCLPCECLSRKKGRSWACEVEAKDGVEPGPRIQYKLVFHGELEEPKEDLGSLAQTLAAFRTVGGGGGVGGFKGFEGFRRFRV